MFGLSIAAMGTANPLGTTLLSMTVSMRYVQVNIIYYTIWLVLTYLYTDLLSYIWLVRLRSCAYLCRQTVSAWSSASCLWTYPNSCKSS